MSGGRPPATVEIVVPFSADDTGRLGLLDDGEAIHPPREPVLEG